MFQCCSLKNEHIIPTIFAPKENTLAQVNEQETALVGQEAESQNQDDQMQFTTTSAIHTSSMAMRTFPGRQSVLLGFIYLYIAIAKASTTKLPMRD